MVYSKQKLIMYEIKELLTDLGLQCSPELLKKLSIKYNVYKRSNNSPIDYVVDYVCYMNSIRLDDFKSKKRNPNLVIARREVMFILYSVGYNMVTIASYMNYDHSTVVHHIHDMNDKFSVMPKTKRLFIDRYKSLLDNDIIKQYSVNAMAEYKYVYKN